MSDEPQTYRDASGDEHTVREHQCDDGWLMDPGTDQPRPCPVCRPHLRRRTDPNGITSWTAKKDPHHHGKDAQ